LVLTGWKKRRTALSLPKSHPCWSGGMPVLVENLAEAVVSSYVEAGGGAGFGAPQIP
jgi:hypothetical protein